MNPLFTLSSIVGLALVGGALAGGEAALAATSQAMDRARPTRLDLERLAQSEVYVPQAKGRVSRDLPPVSSDAPSNSSGAANGVPTTVTCSWTNATSPDCYAATQQARPVAK